MDGFVFPFSDGSPNIGGGWFGSRQSPEQIPMALADYEAQRAALEQALTPDWDGFNAYMLSNDVFDRVFETAPTKWQAALPAAYAQVVTGNLDSFRLVFTQLCATGEATATERTEWADAAEQRYNLPDSFCQLIRGE